MGISQQSNEQRDFHELYVASQGRLYGYIASLLPRREDAEEIFSQTSLILWQKWEQFDASRPFMPWARAIAYNQIRNYLRSMSRQEVLLGEEVLELLNQAQEKFEPLLEQRRAALDDCVRGLVDKERRLLERHYQERESVKQIAETLNLPPSTVYMRLHRIRQFLHECVDQQLQSEREG
jgi:RNA polymerase sigma-70 factor (ECF subfamily)